MGSLVRGTDRTRVSELFFSDVNVRALQHGLRYGVYKASGQVVGDQSRDELLTVMRSVYISDSRNVPYVAPLDEVRALNREVLDFCVPRVAREAGMYLRYRRDIATQPRPLAYGEFTSRAGLRGTNS